MSYHVYWHRRKNTIPNNNYIYNSPYDKMGNKKPFSYENTDINITSNLANMFNWAFNCNDWVDELNCRKGRDVTKIIENAINKMLIYKNEAEKYNATNGWGTYPYAIIFLQNLLESAKIYKNFYLEINR